ncbi:MAG TPA: hypothetical protein DDZ51_07950 [Planctomycetaceae bacterium]|nr:hypothetical protein [Planctomycetaceae bacterium]
MAGDLFAIRGLAEHGFWTDWRDTVLGEGDLFAFQAWIGARRAKACTLRPQSGDFNVRLHIPRPIAWTEGEYFCRKNRTFEVR